MKKIHLIGGISVGVVLILALYLGWFFLVSPKSAEIAAEEANLKKLQNELNEAKTKKREHERFRAQAENVNRNLVFLNSRIDPNFDPNQVYREFNGLAAAHGLADFTLSTGKIENTNQMTQYPVVLGFTAGYHKAGEFLNSAISHRRVIVPSSMDMKLAVDPDGKDSVAVVFGLAIYTEQVKGKAK